MRTEYGVEVSMGSRDAASDLKPEEKFQQIHVRIPEASTSIFVPQWIWDKLPAEKHEDAIALLCGTIDSAFRVGIGECVEVVEILAGVRPVKGDKDGKSSNE